MPLLLSFLCAIISLNFVSAMSTPFQTIDKGHNSGIKDALTEVYRTRQDFETFWTRHGSTSDPPPNVPDVDFATQMVAVVFRGTLNSGGYGVEITSVDRDEDGDRIVVNFMTSDPPPGSIATMALTQPYHVISLGASDENVVFLGSAKPQPPPRFPTFILSLEKENKDAIVAKIEALPSVKNVKALGRLAVAYVDFDSDSISKDEARRLLEAVEGVKRIEED